MNPNMNVTLRRVLNVFIAFLLIISGVAAYVQITNQAFYNGPVLAHGQYDTSEARNCPPYNTPIRGTIYDRNGVPLAWTKYDPTNPNSYCGYVREYDPRVAADGLAPLLGYYSYIYGTAGIENSYNDQLAGVQHGQTFQNVANRLLHRPQYGDDLYLTIDIRLQTMIAQYYNNAAIYFGPGQICPARPASPPDGSITVEDPNTGEILAMYSYPSYDPNQINNQTYFQQLQSDGVNSPLLNRAAQGLYVPGSTFKTLTLIAALDSGQASLATPFTKANAIYFHVPQGSNYNWIDYIAGDWANVHQTLDSGGSISLQDAYAYSDNSVYAREAYDLGANTWLSYARKFGIATPGVSVDPVPFDAPYAQSSVYPAVTNGQATQFTGDDLAASGFGQGQLLISPLTMTEITSSVAAGGMLYDPHAVRAIVPHSLNGPDMKAVAANIAPRVAFSGGPIYQPATAQAMRQAMWAVTKYGTASTFGSNPDPVNGLNVTLTSSPAKEGGKTGTGQIHSGGPRTWWISLAPDDAAPGGGSAQLAVTVMKENNAGDGGCEVYVADDTYVWAQQNGILSEEDKP